MIKLLGLNRRFRVDPREIRLTYLSSADPSEEVQSALLAFQRLGMEEDDRLVMGENLHFRYLGILRAGKIHHLVEVFRMQQPMPPKHADHLIHRLLSEKYAEAVAGDLEERWDRTARTCGIRHATCWYYSQIIRSVAPFAWAAVRRISGIEFAFEVWRRFRG